MVNRNSTARPGRSRRLLGLVAASAAVAVGLVVSAPVASQAAPIADGALVTYSATQTAASPPVTSFAGSADGDGFALAFDATRIYSVFHSTPMKVACLVKATGAPCVGYPKTLGTPADSYSSPRPGLWLDRNTGRLYTTVVRADLQPGVLCIDTTSVAADPSCGFTSLGSQAVSPNVHNLGFPVIVGTNWYFYDAVDFTAQTVVSNRILCFSLTTFTACPGQPYTPNFGNLSASSFTYDTTMNAVGDRLVLIQRIRGGSQIGACFNPVTRAQCTGSWPVSQVAANWNYDDFPFATPVLSPTGTTLGYCAVRSLNKFGCWDLAGAAIASPGPAFVDTFQRTTAFEPSPPLVVGTRIYAAQSTRFEPYPTRLVCYDFALAAPCWQPVELSVEEVDRTYTLQTDPTGSPTCLWTNGHGGTLPIQAFDTVSGRPCSSSDVRLLMSSFVNPAAACRPTSYTKLEITSPIPSAYSGGTVTFQNANGETIPGVSTRPIDGSGVVDLTGLKLSTSSGLPTMLVKLPGAGVTPVTMKVTWQGAYSATCTGQGQLATLTPPTVSAVSASSGPTVGGVPVSITGTEFAVGATVTFGGKPCTNVVVVSATSLTCTTPPNPAGPVTVVVTNPSNASVSVPAGYTYVLVPLTVTPDDKSLIAGTARPASPFYSFVVTGFLNGETAATAVGYIAPACSSTYTTLTTIGTYPGAIRCAGGSASYYSFSYQTATLTVDSAGTAVVTPNDITVTYGQPVPAYTFAVRRNGAAVTLSTPPTCTSSYTVGTPVSASPLAITCSGGASGTYTVDQTPTARLVVVPATLTVTPSNQSVVYGSDPPAPPFYSHAVTGFVNGESSATAAGYVEPECTSGYLATTPVAASPLPIGCSGAAASNYVFVVATANLTITKAALVVTPADQTIDYGSARPGLSFYVFSVSGFLNGDAPDTAAGYTAPVCSSSYTPTTPVSASPRPIACLGGAAGNYTFDTTPTALLTIAKARLQVIPDDKAISAGDPVPPPSFFTFSVVGFENGETPETAAGYLDPSCTSSYAVDTPMGVYVDHIVCSGGAADNYAFEVPEVAPVPGDPEIAEYGGVASTLTVIPAGSVEIFPENLEVTYGDPAPAPAAYTYTTGAPDVLSEQPTCTSDYEPGAPAYSTFVVTCTGGNSATHSVDTTSTATLTVLPAPLTITASNRQFVLGEAVPAESSYEYVITGFRNGDTAATASGFVAPTCTSTYGTATPIGTYADEVTCAAGDAADYVITYVPGDYTVDDELPATGTDPTGLWWTGVVLIGLGLVLTGRRHSRRPAR